MKIELKILVALSIVIVLAVYTLLELLNIWLGTALTVKLAAVTGIGLLILELVNIWSKKHADTPQKSESLSYKPGTVTLNSNYVPVYVKHPKDIKWDVFCYCSTEADAIRVAYELNELNSKIDTQK